MNIRSSGDTFGKVAAHLRGSAAVPRSSSMRPDASDAVRAKAASPLHHAGCYHREYQHALRGVETRSKR